MSAAEQIWAVISVVIAAGFAVGIGLGLYNSSFLLPYWLDVFGFNLFNTAIAVIVVFACMAVVLFKGVHPN